MKKLIIISSILILMNSCGSSKKTYNEDTTSKIVNKNLPQKNNHVISNDQKNLDFATLRYIAKYADISKKEMKDYGIPASITLAQGILESQSGKSRLAVEGKNHFGIKCHNDWRGDKILHDDNEAQECFRKYNKAEESFKDHSKFLAGRKRYAFLFRLPKTDYEAWARGLKKAGYATDPSYPDKLIYIINKYNLAKMDKEVLENMSVKVDDATNKHKNGKKKFIYEVQEGETLFTISRKFNVPVKDIQRINNLNDFDIYKGQILVLTGKSSDSDSVENDVEESLTNDNNETLKPEKVAISTQENNPKAEADSTSSEINADDIELHMVKQGETLFSISKKYQVDVAVLKNLNKLNTNEIKVGKVIKIPKNSFGTTKNTVAEKSQNKEIKQTPEDNNAVYHVVQPGETLYRIHINYHVSIKKLRKLNHLKGNYIKVGQKLRVK